MKKIFIAGAAVLMLAAAGCKGSNYTPGDLKTPQDTAANYFGQMFGASINQSIQRMDSIQREQFDKNEILKGIEVAMAADTSMIAYIQGMQIGTSIIAQLQNWNREGISIDKNQVYAAFKEAFMADSISEDPMVLQRKLRPLLEDIHTKTLENSPVALKNKKEGAEFIESEMKKDAAFKKTESGLVYKVIAEGEGAPIMASDRVKVKYTGKFINGKEFDSSGDETRTFAPSNLVPGFREALLMMKPGAHYLVYIPGELGYGAAGQPYANIEPYATLIFDIEVVGIDEK